MISPPFHSGLVVTDLDGAMSELESAFGLSWSSIRESETAVWTQQGRVDLVFRGGFSAPGPSRLELIEAVPGTMWDGPPGMSLHHVSFWSSDLEEDSAELARQGFPLVATTWMEDREGRATLFAYHRRGTGPLMELLDEGERPSYEQWWNEIPSS